MQFQEPTDPIDTMSPHLHSDPPTNQLPGTVRDIANQAAEAAKEMTRKANATVRDVTESVEDATADVSHAAKDALKNATATAKDLYESASVKAGDALANSKEYVRQNPIPAVLGGIAFGLALGYMLATTRHKPTFRERYADEPLGTMREAILSALGPVAHRVHEGFDSARDGAGKAMHSLGSGRNGYSLSDKIGSIGNNLKFW